VCERFTVVDSLFCSIITSNVENGAKFKFLGTTLTNQNDIHDEIKSR